MNKPSRFPLNGNSTNMCLVPLCHWDIDHRKIKTHNNAPLPLKKNHKTWPKKTDR